jgi:hypothetical protein
MKTLSRYRKLAVVAAASASILFVTNLWCQTPDSSTHRDTVFVEQAGQKGYYRPIIGQVRELTPTYVIIQNLEGASALYTREVVATVRLDQRRSGDDREYREWSDRIEAYWKPEASMLVRFLKSFPISSEPLNAILSKLPSGVDTVAALIILFFALCYALYWLYDFVLVSRRAKALDHEKLQMEIAKIRYEISTLKKALGLPEPVPSEPVDGSVAVRRPVHEESRIHVVDVLSFLKHKVLRVPSEEQTSHRTELWNSVWLRYSQRKRWLPSVMYFIRLSLNYIFTIITVVLFLMWTIDIYVFSSNTAIGEANIWMSILCIFLSIAFLGLLVRLNANRRMMKLSYRESIRSGT